MGLISSYKTTINIAKKNIKKFVVHGNATINITHKVVITSTIKYIIGIGGMIFDRPYKIAVRISPATIIATMFEIGTKKAFATDLKTIQINNVMIKI
jgi:hypothetical protein